MSDMSDTADATEHALMRSPNGDQPSEKTYTMQGFDDFDDIVHYIAKSTYMIWDENNIGLIYRFYTPTTVVYTSDGRSFGRDIVVETSMQKMAAFPDIRDFIEDTIWAGSDQDNYRTSMRWTWTATNTGYGIYGLPTGKRVVVSGIANCVVRGEHIIEEWVAYNEMSLIRQLGLNWRDVLDVRMANQPSPETENPAFGKVERLRGQEPPEELPPPPAHFEIDDFVRRAYHEIWNWRLFGRIRDYFVPNYRCHGASDTELYGRGDYMQDILARLAMFPDMRVYVDDHYWIQESESRYRCAVLWYMLGTHTGPSRYGAPTGRRARIMGISQHIVENGRFVEEWTEWGEFNMLKQIYGQDRSAASVEKAITDV